MLVLPGRFSCEPERVWLSVLIDELDRVNIKLQSVHIRSIAVDPEAHLRMRRVRTTRRQKSSAERQRRQ